MQSSFIRQTRLKSSVIGRRIDDSLGTMWRSSTTKNNRCHFTSTTKCVKTETMIP